MLRFLVTTSYNIPEALTKFQHFWSLQNIYIILNSSNQIHMGSFKNPKCLEKMCITSDCCFQHFPKTMNIFEKHFGFTGNILVEPSEFL